MRTMKKFLIILPIFSALHADLHYSFAENKYYTTPESPEIDATEYDVLATLVNILNMEYVNAGLSAAERYSNIDAFLIAQNNATALRLLNDLRKIRL